LFHFLHPFLSVFDDFSDFADLPVLAIFGDLPFPVIRCGLVFNHIPA